MAEQIRDRGLSVKGRDRVEWAINQMPVVSDIRARFRRTRPLKGRRIAACLHVTTETAALMLALRDGGAEVRLCASNPLSTQDDVAAFLTCEEGIPTFAIHGIDTKGYYEHIEGALAVKPDVTMDDGADLVTVLHTKRRDLLRSVIAGTEETTTGVVRLRAMAAHGKLNYPIIAINDSMTKYLFDNRYGTGQSSMDGIMRATNILLAGRAVVVAGYGWCGRGVAGKARGLGANVIVTEVDPHHALEAAMDGFTVMPMIEAARKGTLFITVTGDTSVIRREHLAVMQDGAILANSGHFNVEIDISALEKMAKSKRTVRSVVTQYTLKNGRRLNLIGEGRLVNLAAAEGHPANVMDMSFANQALTVEYLAKKARSLKKQVYVVPLAIDREVARLKLAAMGLAIDHLTAAQQKYLTSWEFGTT
ncbi:MAG: adenosylhomocysteinase [Candidatus Coatesbacteria bacterium]